MSVEQAAKELRDHVAAESKRMASIPQAFPRMPQLPEGIPLSLLGPLLEQYGPLVTQTALHWMNDKYGDILEKLVKGAAPTIKNYVADAELAKLADLIELIRKPDSLKIILP